MSCGIQWVSLKCELRAYAGLLPLLKGDWTNCWCSEVYCSGASGKGWFYAARMAPSLSSRVMIVFWSVPVFAVRLAVRVPKSTLFNSWGLPTWRQEMSLLRWNMKRSQIFQFFAELLSLDAWRLVDYGRFVRDEDILFLEKYLLVKNIGICVSSSCLTISHWFCFF